jgi:hypothetical protein
MTQYNFAPQTLDVVVQWDDPAIWAGGVVPNAANADVVIGPVTENAGNQPLSYILEIGAGESFAENTVSVTSNTIALDGTLSVAGVLSLGGAGELDLDGGLLSAGTLENGGFGFQGSGTIVTPGTFINTGMIASSIGSLTLDVGALQNSGELFADGEFNVNFTGAHASPFNGTLTGGTYAVEPGGTLVLGLGAAITVDAADIQFGTPIFPENVNSAIESVDSSGNTLALQNTLRTIAATGTFSVFGGAFDSTQAVTLDGSLVLSSGGTFSAQSTTISAMGTVFGVGTLAGPLVDNGVVSSAGSAFSNFGTLVISGDVSGSGSLLIAPPVIIYVESQYEVTPNILELQEACSVGVTFQAGAGELVLDDPQGFSGTITPSAPEFTGTSANGPLDYNIVQLTGISLASVTSYRYSGNAVGGVLTISEGSVSQTLNFAGDLDTQSFALSAGPQLLSSSPPSLDITITPVPASPAIWMQTATSTSSDAVIVNTTTPTVTGLLPAGATLFFYGATGLAVTKSPVSANLTESGYTATINGLVDGANTVFAAASNAAGSASSQEPLQLFVLPDPVGGITTAAVDSLQMSALQKAGYGTQFVAGTEAIQLTDGTLSVGEDTGDAYLQRLYEGLLGRAGDTAGLEANAAQLASVGMAAMATDFLNSAEFQAKNPAVAGQTNGNFLVFLYRNFLGRAPDSAGFNAYVKALQSGVSRGAVVAAFAESAESKAYLQQDTSAVWVPSEAGGLITELFHTALDRAPDLGGLSTFTDALQNGASMLQIVQAIVASPEFAADHAGLTATGLVTSFYEDGLGRQPDSGGLQTYLGELQSGASVSQVLLAIASSPEAGLHLLPSVS